LLFLKFFLIIYTNVEGLGGYMDGRKNKSINDKRKLVKRSAELSKALDNSKNSIEDLKEFKKDYSLLFNKMLNGFALHEIILDKEGKPCDYRFLEVNPAFEKLTGLKKAKIIGKTALEVLPGFEPYWIDIYGKVVMTGKLVQFENYSQSLNRYYTVNAYSPKKGYFVTIFSDITGLRRREEEIIKLFNFQNAVRTINQLLLRTNNEKDLYKKICNIVTKVEFIKFMWIGLANEESFEIKPVAYAGAELGFLSKIKVKYDASQFGNGPTGTAVKSGKPFIINDIKSDSRYIPWREEALRRNFTSDITLPLIHKDKIIGAMNIYSDKENAFGKKEAVFLKEVANDIAVGVKSIRSEKNLQKKNKQLEKSTENIIFAMARMSESKDPYTAGHQKRVSQLSTAIAKIMKLPEDKIESLKFASLIHDIGKVSIPGEILSKPSKLTKTEFALIKEHPKTCYNIIKDIDFPWEIASIILQHHERLDGSGYPMGLKDKEILLEAKILAVADVVEAMNSFRPYRPALGIDKALEEISMNKGKLYDPEVVDACIKLFKEDGFKFK